MQRDLEDIRSTLDEYLHIELEFNKDDINQEPH